MDECGVCDGLSNSCAVTAQLQLLANSSIVYGDAVVVSLMGGCGPRAGVLAFSICILDLCVKCMLGLALSLYCPPPLCLAMEVEGCGSWLPSAKGVPAVQGSGSTFPPRFAAASSHLVTRPFPLFLLQETVIDDFFANLTSALQLAPGSLERDGLALGGGASRRRRLHQEAPPANASATPTPGTGRGPRGRMNCSVRFVPFARAQPL